MKNPYSSIINFNKLEQYELERLHLGKPESYKLYEKIHGQNISFRINNENIEIRSRKVVIGYFTKENIHTCDLITLEISQSILKVINHIQEKLSGKNGEIIIYGELFGGYYNNKKGPKRIIQHGIQYDKNHRFLIFDISIDDKFISLDLLYYIIGSILKLQTIPIFLCSVNFNEVLDFINDNINSTESKIPQLYGNEKIENNFIEGFVLRIGNNPDLRIKFISDKYYEVKKGKTFVNTNKLELINHIYNNFNTNLIIEKTIGKLNIDFSNKEDRLKFKELINIIFQEINYELKFENQDDINLLKSIAGKLFGNYYKLNYKNKGEA